jgi:hypothetical protein
MKRKIKGNTVEEEMEKGEEKKVVQDEKVRRQEVKEVRRRTQDRDVAMKTFTWILAKT